MSWTATVRYGTAPAPEGLAFAQDLMNTISAGKPRTADLLADPAEAQTWLDQALTEWSRITGTSMAGIELAPQGQEKLRAFRDDLRRAAGQGRDAALPTLHTADIAMRLGGAFCDEQQRRRTTPPQRLADLLGQITTMDDIVAAAQYCVMDPFGAQALILTSASEDRLWVLGHSGASCGLVKSLHGARLDSSTPAAEAVRGRPLFICALSASGRPGSDVHAEAYLPLIGCRKATDLPLVGSRNVVGACCLTFQAPRGFPPEERAVLTMMAEMLGAAVERVELSEKQHEVAEYLQRRLLPSTLSELPGLTTTARYRPATATSKAGGDWYDVIKLPGERMALVVGDVEGHAMESAAVMGQVRTAVAAYATEGHRPATVIDRTGRLPTELGTDVLVTCCVVALDTTDGMAEVALAGHPEPLVRGPDGGIRTLEAPANVPLGVRVPGAYGGVSTSLSPDPSSCSTPTVWSTGTRATRDPVREHCSAPEAAKPGPIWSNWPTTSSPRIAGPSTAATTRCCSWPAMKVPSARVRPERGICRSPAATCRESRRPAALWPTGCPPGGCRGSPMTFSSSRPRSSPTRSSTRTATSMSGCGRSQIMSGWR